MKISIIIGLLDPSSLIDNLLSEGFVRKPIHK